MVRPRRLYTDDKGKFYYIINKKKVFIKVPKGVSQKQIQKVNIRNIVTLPETKKIKRRKKKIKPKFGKVPSTNLSGLLEKQTQGGLPYYIFKEKKDFPTLEEISKGVKQEKQKEIKSEKPVSETTSPMLTAMKPEPKTKEVVNLVSPSPQKTSIFSYLNPFQKKKPPIEIPSTPTSLQILPVQEKSSIDYVPYFEVMKDNNKLNVNKNVIKLFREKKLAVPDEGTKEYKDWKKNFDQARKLYLNTLEEQNIKESLLQSYPKANDNDLISTAELPILGKGVCSDDEGLYNDQIEKILTKRIKDFVPIIPADKTDELLDYVNSNTKRFGAIVNTADSSSDGTGENGNSLGHWTAIYINNEDDYPSIEYYDPLVEGDIPDRLYKSLRKIAKKMNPETLFKFKPNMIRRQDINTSSCGWFCLKFLDDRFNGIEFHEASGYSDFIEQHKGADGSKDGEKEIQDYKKKYCCYV